MRRATRALIVRIYPIRNRLYWRQIQRVLVDCDRRYRDEETVAFWDRLRGDCEGRSW